MKIILNEKVNNLGEVGDVVSVKDGFARNYLFPRELALPFNAHNEQLMEVRKKKIQRRLELEKMSAMEQKQKIEEISITIAKKAGETDTLFGSVTTMEIEEKLAEQGVNIERKKLHLDEPIKKLGSFVCKVRLMEEIDADLNIEVVREGEPEDSEQ